MNMALSNKKLIYKDKNKMVRLLSDDCGNKTY